MDTINRLMIDRVVKLRQNKPRIRLPIRKVPRNITRRNSAPDLLGYKRQRLYEEEVPISLSVFGKEHHDYGEDRPFLSSSQALKRTGSHFPEGLRKSESRLTEELVRTGSFSTEDLNLESKPGDFRRKPTLGNVYNAPMNVNEGTAARGKCCSFFAKLPVAPQTGNLGYDIYHVLTYSSTRIGSALSAIIMTVIVISIASLMVASFPAIRREKRRVHGLYYDDYVEIGCLAVFIVEYFLRILTSVAIPDWQYNPEVHDVEPDVDGEIPAYQCKERSTFRIPAWKKILKFAIDPMNIIDLIAILPSLIEFAVGSGGGGFLALRVLRLGRVLRLLRLTKGARAARLLTKTLQESKEALLILLLYLSFLCVLFGTGIYFAERGGFDEGRRVILTQRF